MKIRILLFSMILLMASSQARGQFYSDGCDPGSLKWSSVETATYRIIYPRGLDSLARVYAANLENCADAVGWSIGYRPNSSYRKKMPVVLHPYNVSSNGLVTWAPRRLELITTPEVYSSDALPWVKMLSLHESRHVAQMQFGNSHSYRFLNWIIGEGAAGALPAICGGRVFMEGDAVATETALSASGRGRSADFLEYMRVCFADGQMRDYWKWRYGSQRYYTPDFYKVGYLKMAGLRTEFDIPELPGDYYDRLFSHHGITIANFGKNLKDSGAGSFKESFERVCAALDSTWRADAAGRAPFMSMQQLTPDTRMFTQYEGLETDGNSLLAIRKGISSTPAIVRIGEDGSVRRISAIPSSSSRLQGDGGGNFYWSEYQADLRWEQASYSVIKRMDPEGRISAVTRRSRYYNPVPHSGMLAVTELPVDGSSRIVLIDAFTGAEISHVTLPDGFQAAESVWAGDEIYVCALSDNGFGIYALDGFAEVLPPQPVKINHLGYHEGRITFVSDFNGVNELYALDPASSQVTRLSSTPQGATDFRFKGDSLWFTVLEPDGRKIYGTDISNLQEKTVDFARDRYRYEIADKLSEMEQVHVPDSFDGPISEPQDYSKLSHLMKFHTWAPLFVNYDKVSDISMETVFQIADLGATAFFQNELSTADGYAAFRLNHKTWRPSAMLKYNWHGWYPEIEASLEFNNRENSSIRFIHNEEGYKQDAVPGGLPYLYGSIRSYIPFNFSSGGWIRGLIPQIEFGMSNDTFEHFESSSRDKAAYSSRLTAGVRGYTMLGTAESCIYPRLGIGAEIGISARPGFTDFIRSNAYAYLYGYVPGIMDTHGIRLSALFQCHASKGYLTEQYANTLPRGFESSAGSYTCTFPVQSKFTFDYALPFAPMDWSFLSPIAYFRNLELTLHTDYGLYATPLTGRTCTLYSAGADLALRFGAVFGIPAPIRIGVTYNYNNGSCYDELSKQGLVSSHHSVELLFGAEF